MLSSLKAPRPAQHFIPAAEPGDAADQAGLLELLSERLLSDFSVSAWRDVFVGKSPARVRFQRRVGTLLCCEPPSPKWSDADLETFTAHFAGRFEPFRGAPLFHFSSVRPALGMAVLLQRTCRRKIRVAVLTGAVTEAQFELFGERKAHTIGESLEAVHTLMRKAPAGSIKMCPDSYCAVASSLDADAGGAIVTTEYQGDDVISAHLTLAPPSNSEFSTFAGLGLT